MPGVGRRRYGHSHGAVERYNCVRPIFCAKADPYGQSLLSPRQSPEGPLAANSFRGQPGRFKHANTPNRRALSATLSKLGRRITHKSAPSGASTIPPSCWKTFLFFWRSRLLAKLFWRRWSLIKMSGSSGKNKTTSANDAIMTRGANEKILLQHIAYIGTCVFYSINRN